MLPLVAIEPGPYPNWALTSWEIFKLLFMHHLIFGL